MKNRIILLVLFVLLAVSCKKVDHYISITGTALGTTYSITYYDEQGRNFQTSVDSLLKEFNRSLSVYDKNSIISKVNRNEPVEVDGFFTETLLRSKEISIITEGAFDASGAPLFSAWHFGPTEEERRVPDSRMIDSLRQLVGMDKIHLDLTTKHVVKDDPRVVLSMNAIAKGYSSDVVATFLDDKGIQHYLIEIGGEMRMKGKNKKGTDWEIGIDQPVDGNYMPGASLQAIIRVSNKGLATSGNYRQFFIENGKKYAHTIDPRTGYPVEHSLLSVTVVADDCMTADAIATALMVMGIDGAKVFLEAHPEYDAYLIYDSKGEFKTYATPNMLKLVEEQAK